MEEIAALIQGGGGVEFARDEKGNVVCTWTPGPKEAEVGHEVIAEAGPTVVSALSTVVTEARARTARMVNQPR